LALTDPWPESARIAADPDVLGSPLLTLGHHGLKESGVLIAEGFEGLARSGVLAMNG
jgi:hypothetical protein